MKKCLLLCTAVIFFQFLHAQINWFASAGIQFSNWRGNGKAILDSTVGENSNYAKQAVFAGYYAGFGMNISLGEYVELEPGLRYSRVGSSFSKNIDFTQVKNNNVDGRAKVVTHNIELPLLFRSKITGGLYVVLGPQFNYAFSNKLEFKNGKSGAAPTQRDLNVGQYFNDLSASAIGGINFRFPIGIQLQAVYEWGLTDIFYLEENVFQNSLKIGMYIPFRYQRNQEEEWY